MQREKQVRTILSSISEELLILTYQKITDKNTVDFPIKIKKECTFYLTIFYQGSKIRSHSISNVESENRIGSKELEALHFKMSEDLINSKEAQDFRTSKHDKTFLFSIKIGHTVINISNSNQNSVELFAFIFAAQFLLLKHTILVKEWGTWKDLMTLAKKASSGVSYKYLETVDKIAFGILGGHH